MDFKEKLKARAEKEGISLTPKQLGQFELNTLKFATALETHKSKAALKDLSLAKSSALP